MTQFRRCQLREALGNLLRSHQNGPVITGRDWIDGRQQPDFSGCERTTIEKQVKSEKA